MQKVILLPQNHLLDDLPIRVSGKEVEMKHKHTSFRQILRIIKRIFEIILLVVKIIRELQ